MIELLSSVPPGTITRLADSRWNTDGLRISAKPPISNPGKRLVPHHAIQDPACGSHQWITAAEPEWHSLVTTLLCPKGCAPSSADLQPSNRLRGRTIWKSSQLASPASGLT